MPNLPLRRAPRSSSRETLTLPHRRLSASLPHHGPPPATPRPMTYHPRDNATAHGPRPTRQRPTASDETTQRVTSHRQRRTTHATTSTASDAAPTTQPGQRCRGARAKLTAPPIRQRRHPRTQRRISGRGHHQRSPAPSHTTDAAAPARGTNAATHPSDAAPHDVTRAPEQSIRAPHSYPTTHQRSDTGRGAKHHRAPSTTGQLGYTTTPRTTRPTRQDPTRV